MCYGIIYKIENKVNGKIYIGQTTKKSFDERYRGDVERNTHNKHLQNSIKKYGIENFKIDECLCECDSEEELNEAEKFYIDYFNTMDPNHGYNKREGGNGGKLSDETKEKLSESIKKALADPETKKKMSEARKGKYCGEKNPMWGKHAKDYMTEEAIQMRRKKISESLKGEKNPMYGKPLSNEHKRKLSEAKKGKHLSEETKQKISKAQKGRPLSDEHKRKLSAARKGKHYEALSGKNNPNARAVIQLSKNGDFIRKYNSISEASRELNIAGQHICACCRGRRKSAGGYIWKYSDEFKNETTGEPVVPDINTHI